jgi:hypothetical protein
MAGARSGERRGDAVDEGRMRSRRAERFAATHSSQPPSAAPPSPPAAGRRTPSANRDDHPPGVVDELASGPDLACGWMVPGTSASALTIRPERAIRSTIAQAELAAVHGQLEPARRVSRRTVLRMRGLDPIGPRPWPSRYSHARLAQ